MKMNNWTLGSLEFDHTDDPCGPEDPATVYYGTAARERGDMVMMRAHIVGNIR
jgi:hypothetical protein